MTDSSFNPTDAAGLAAWFARAESHATRLRRRLIDLVSGSGVSMTALGQDPRFQAPRRVVG